MEPSIILKIIDVLEMDPHGIFTGAIGAMLSLFVVNGTAFSWRKTGLILFAGVTVCGYTMPWVEPLLIDDGDSRALAHLANMLIGFVASDLLSSIKTAAPTATNFLVQKVLRMFQKSPPTKDKNDG